MALACPYFIAASAAFSAPIHKTSLSVSILIFFDTQTKESLATFKKVMDTYIIPLLKNPKLFPDAKLHGIDMSRYTNNAFIQALSRSVIGDSRSGRVKSY